MTGRVTTVKRLAENIVFVKGRDAPLETYIITHRADEPCAARKLAELYGREIAIDPWNPAGRGFMNAIATLPHNINLRDELPPQLKRQVYWGEPLVTPNWVEARAIKIHDKSLNRLLRPSPNKDIWLRIRGWYADPKKEEFGVTMIRPDKIYDLAESLSELGEVRYRRSRVNQDMDTLEANLYVEQSKKHQLPPKAIPLQI